MTRPLRTAVALVFVLGGAMLGPGAYHRRDALASPTPPGPGPSPSASAPAVVRLSGTVKEAKLPAPELSGAPQVDGCVVSAYAKLAGETAHLAETHAGDPPGFAKAYKARKEAVVGAAALRAAGCKRPGDY